MTPKYAKANFYLGGPVSMEDVTYYSLESKDDPQAMQEAYFKDFVKFIKEEATETWDHTETDNGLRIDLYSTSTLMDDFMVILA